MVVLISIEAGGNNGKLFIRGKRAKLKCEVLISWLPDLPLEVRIAIVEAMLEVGFIRLHTADVQYVGHKPLLLSLESSFEVSSGGRTSLHDMRTRFVRQSTVHSINVAVQVAVSTLEEAGLSLAGISFPTQLVARVAMHLPHVLVNVDGVADAVDGYDTENDDEADADDDSDSDSGCDDDGDDDDDDSDAYSDMVDESSFEGSGNESLLDSQRRSRVKFMRVMTDNDAKKSGEANMFAAKKGKKEAKKQKKEQTRMKKKKGSRK